MLSTAGEAVAPDELADHLVDLQGAGLVRLVPGTDAVLYRFRHALVQEAAYDSLLRAERTTLHGAVGSAMERGDPGTLDEVAARISEHFELAGDAARSFPWARRAADADYSRYALPEAVAQYRRAIALAAAIQRPADELTELYLRAGRATELMDRYADAVAIYVEMLERARGLGDRPMELAAMAARATGEAIGVATGNFDPATKERALEALDLARELGDRSIEAKVLWTLLLTNRFGWGDDAVGIRYGRESLALAKSIGDETQAALTAQDLAQSLLAVGELEPARSSFDESIAFWQRAGNLPLAANGLRVRGEAEYLLGDLDYAQASYRESLEIDETTGNVWGRAISRMGLGALLVESGRHEEGLPLIVEARAIADASDLTILRLNIMGVYAWALIITGQTDLARGLLGDFDPSGGGDLPGHRPDPESPHRRARAGRRSAGCGPRRSRARDGLLRGQPVRLHHPAALGGAARCGARGRRCRAGAPDRTPDPGPRARVRRPSVGARGASDLRAGAPEARSARGGRRGASRGARDRPRGRAAV